MAKADRSYTARMNRTFIAASGFMLLGASLLLAQAVGGPEKGVPVKGDPGISSMRVLDRPDFFVLRDWAEPGAVRRMHNHPGTTYHIFTLVSGQLRLTIEGQPPVDVKQGEVVELNNAAMHTFTNTGTVTATIVEVFGRAQSSNRLWPPALAGSGSGSDQRLPGLISSEMISARLPRAPIRFHTFSYTGTNTSALVTRKATSLARRSVCR